MAASIVQLAAVDSEAGYSPTPFAESLPFLFKVDHIAVLKGVSRGGGELLV